jgi:hypothetical protein
MIVKPDVKQSVDLMRYLERPTNMVHVNSSRYIVLLLNFIKFIVGIGFETALIFNLSALSEDESDLQQILITFVIYVAIYEAPTLFFKLK